MASLLLWRWCFLVCIRSCWRFAFRAVRAGTVARIAAMRALIASACSSVPSVDPATSAAR